MTRPTGTVEVDGHFQYLTGPASPGTFEILGRFHILESRPVSTFTISGAYATEEPDPDSFFYDGTALRAQVYYYWDGTGWVPVVAGLLPSGSLLPSDNLFPR